MKRCSFYGFKMLKMEAFRRDLLNHINKFLNQEEKQIFLKWIFQTIFEVYISITRTIHRVHFAKFVSKFISFNVN